MASASAATTAANVFNDFTIHPLSCRHHRRQQNIEKNHFFHEQTVHDHCL
jgi:hypothetical protein